jgi:hypothetical protein
VQRFIGSENLFFNIERSTSFELVIYRNSDKIF